MFNWGLNWNQVARVQSPSSEGLYAAAFDTRAINRADPHPVTHEGVRDEAESQTQVLRGNSVFEP